MAETAPRIGDPIRRFDSIAKVTGAAAFPSDVPVERAAHAVLVTSKVALGRIRAIRSDAAAKIPGFLLLLTHENTKGEIQTPRAFVGKSTTTLENADILHDGQIIGLVVAETFEAAQECARLVTIDYDVASPSAGFDSAGVQANAVHTLDDHHEDPVVGDAAAAFTAATVKIDARYYTPTQHHNAIELLTTTCFWTGDRLTVHEPSQFVLDRGLLAASFKMPVDNIRVVSRYCGGGFGGKTSGTPRTVLAAIAARRLGRPVKLTATRQQGFTINTYRAETRHHVRLAADASGKFVALHHEGWEVSSRPSPYTVGGTEATARMYACPNIWTRVNVVQGDRNTPGFMRCPAELPYMFALESAVDELAYAMAIDPVELRRRNDTKVDPVNGHPFSSRSLVECYDRGAEVFGWKDRAPKPGTMRDGDWLVGFGCATACYPANRGASAVRISLDGQGHARVQVAFHEIGNGAYTVIAQTAAALLGIPVSAVRVELGDTLLPVGNIAAGSSGTVATCNAVANACEDIRVRLAKAAAEGEGALRGADAAKLRLQDGKLAAPGRSESLRTAIARLGGMVEVTSSYVPAEMAPGALDRLKFGVPALSGGVGAMHTMFSFGAQFIEVRVHRLTHEVRVPRAVGIFAAGRIVNRRTAESQLMGGMIWGIGSALLEETLIDRPSARYLNTNLADYLIATNADVPDVRVEMLDEIDAVVNPLGVKGVGELGCSGTNAAVANAVFAATGVRVRDLPIRARSLSGAMA